MTVGRYLDEIIPLLEDLRAQGPAIERAATVCADAIGGGGVVHVFGAGHSRMMAEEAYPRIGAVAGFRPVVELAITFFHNVVGPNGLRQTLFLERVPGYGKLIFDELAARPGDAAIVFSSSGVEVIILDFVDAARAAGLPVVGVTSLEYSARTSSERGGARRLADVADVVIDNGVPVGDALVVVPDLDERVAPSASI
ncbi:MAG: sugar isomerase domain-containing protein, partial [Chloroflexota bacterium]